MVEIKNVSLYIYSTFRQLLGVDDSQLIMNG